MIRRLAILRCGARLLLICLASSCARPGSQVHAANTSQKHLVTRYDGPVVDVHAHVFFDPVAARSLNPQLPATPENLKTHVEDGRVRHVGAIVMAPRGSHKTRILNDQLHGFVSANAARFFAIGSVHPDDGEAALKELVRLKKLGFKAIKLHPNTQQFDVSSPAVQGVVAKATGLGLPVLFDFSGMLNTTELGKYLILAVQNPDARIILAHIGGTRFRDTAILPLLKDFEWFKRNIWFDISGVAKLYVDSPMEAELVWTIRKIGTDRVLFGSDFPLTTPAKAIDHVERLGFSQKEMSQIFWGNATALFGLTGDSKTSARDEHRSHRP